MLADRNMHPSPMSPEQRSEMHERRRLAQQEIRSTTVGVSELMGSKYVKRRVLGEGAFGQAWLCADRANKRKAVVKIARRVIQTSKQDFDAKKELWTMQRMRHPNIVAFYEAWLEKPSADQCCLHIAMEYCDSADLGKLISDAKKAQETVGYLCRVGELVREKVRQRRSSPSCVLHEIDSPKWCTMVLHGSDTPSLRARREAHTELNLVVEEAWEEACADGKGPRTFTQVQLESWMVQILWGLWHIHKHARTMHRDIKPDNIFLSCGGKIVKIGDFGLSGLSMVTGGEAETGLGTPLFMAPEMWGDSGSYTDRVDTFAVGVTMYQLVTLACPWEGNLPGVRLDKKAKRSDDPVWGSLCTPSTHKFLIRQLTALDILPPGPPPALVDPGLWGVIASMMCKMPGLRPTVGQVLRSRRMQPAARKVIAVLKQYGRSTADIESDPELSPGQSRGCDEDEEEFLSASDARHGNVVNPVDRVGCLASEDGRLHYDCSTTAEVHRGLGQYTIRVRADSTPYADVIGKLPPDGIVEVLEKRRDRTGQLWFKVACGETAGWCISMVLPPAGRGEQLFARVPAEQIGRQDPAAVSVAEEAAAMVSEALCRSPKAASTPAASPRSSDPAPPREASPAPSPRKFAGAPALAAAAAARGARPAPAR
eukprot:TRINITY_DN2057_c0_g1_i1.p1 TRINITY_DN2057_c0_g1~~TRINITY_DN2057_c0_g1_i1.p1  ORF type:complete len:676 (+),score=221.59 TRINITY_DN2057_c0_g1_i1:72-2030(+)